MQWQNELNYPGANQQALMAQMRMSLLQGNELNRNQNFNPMFPELSN